MQIDKRALEDFLNEHWLLDNTGHPEDVGYQAALRSLVDWFGLEAPED